MIFVCKPILILLTFSHVFASEVVDYKTLYEIQKRINDNTSVQINKYGDQLTPVSTIFLEKHFESHINRLPILVLGLDYHTDRLGNFIGNYFDSIACAFVTGTHFIGVKKLLVGHHRDRHEAFYEALPDIILHRNPITDYDAIAPLVKKLCPCGRYCWNENDPWAKIIPLIRNIVLRGLHLHLAMKDKYGITAEFHGMPIIGGRDVTTSPTADFYPLIPDVAIHYRCSDNLYGGMGLLSFGTIISRIPKEAKYIYIFTEYGSRLKDRPMEKAAPVVLKALFDDILRNFPNAVVVVKKGGNELTIWAQFGLANVTICSPSTFCLWPAIARTTTTYMPATNYIGHLPFHPTFHWIKDPKIYNNFTAQTPVGHILDVLRHDVK